jgi:hypothetical protein
MAENFKEKLKSRIQASPEHEFVVLRTERLHKRDKAEERKQKK